MQVLKSRLNFWPRRSVCKDVNRFLGFIARRKFSVSYSNSINLPDGQTKIRTSDFRFLFLGSDDFSISSLEAVLRVCPPANLTVVVSNENNLMGKYARGKEIQVMHWDTLKKASAQEGSRSEGHQASTSTQPKFDLGVVASFGHLIPERVIRTCQRGILNVHGSLLPKWRGAAPVAHAIINGDTVTGVTIMKIAPYKFDIGPTLSQVAVPIHPHIRAVELRQYLAKLGANALETLLQSHNFEDLLQNAMPQSGTTYLAQKLTPEMANVQWEVQSAISIYNLFRGLSGSFKLKTKYMGRTVDLDDLSIYSSEDTSSRGSTRIQSQNQTINSSTDFSNYYSSPVTTHVKSLPNSDGLAPGHIYYADNILCVKCTGKDAEDVKQNWIFIRKVKIGTKWMSAKDFRNGFLTKSLAVTFFESITPNSDWLKNQATTS